MRAFAQDRGTELAAAVAASAQPQDSLSWWEAIILGLVEGITEYLPVSSTGHLLVTAELLGLNNTATSEAAVETFAICIQLGAILAVLLLYRERIQTMIQGLLGRSAEGRSLLIALIAAFVPTAIIGVTLRTIVKDRLFGVEPTAAAWIVGGLIVLVLSRQGWFSRGGDALTSLTPGKAAVIGFAQAIALWPGVSRSLVTIIAAVAVGLSLTAAVEFSFLLGLITLSAATVLEGAAEGSNLIDTFGWATPLLGLLIAFLSAVIAIRWMVSWLERRGFEAFGWYRLAAGALALTLMATGVLGGA